jgi:predicted metal-dependent hydrolase
MAQKRVLVPELGEIILSKRRGARNMRLSVSAKGEIRVGMPAWVPYSAGIKFALSRQDWLAKHASAAQPSPIQDNSRIGKSYRVKYLYDPELTTTSVRITGQTIKIGSHLSLDTKTVQAKAVAAAERAMKKEAEQLLPQRLKALARKHGYSHKGIKIRKLVSRWGSCSSDRVISLSYFLMQLPWELIDYVILHELVHTEHMNHSPGFWKELETVCPDARERRKIIKKFRPVINAVTPDVA